MIRLKELSFWAALFLIVALALPAARTIAAEHATRQATSLTVLNYVTGWSHDALGYHPAIWVLLENTSGRDMSNKLLRFQARFTDMQTAEVSVGRAEIRKECKPHQQISVFIEAPRPYELPFEVYLWPIVEGKVMCKPGSSGSEETETLLIAKLESVTRTTDEAFQLLNQSAGYNRGHPQPGNKHAGAVSHAHAGSTPHHQTSHQPVVSHEVRKSEPPMMATAGKVKLPDQPNDNVSNPMTLLSSKTLPGLGDDFYNFEQRFGLPTDLDAKHTDFTWAQYRHRGTGTEIVAGSRERTGKVDILILRVPKSSADEFALVTAAKSMAGKLRQQPLGQAKKSVRYLPSGRVELVSAGASGYKVVCLASRPNDSDNSFILVLSRLQQDMEPLLSSLSHKSPLLKSLKFLEAGEGDRPGTN